MAILVLNPGSTTLKAGIVEDGIVTWSKTVETWDLAVAARNIFSEITHPITAIGCRVVHGGSTLIQPTRVTDAVINQIEVLGEIAPLHNFGAAAVLRACSEVYPELPVIAVFDTAFHQTLPELATTYGISADIAEREGLRRYGFHGISHQTTATSLTHLLEGEKRPTNRLITCHLGGGVSLCAILDGKSIDTTMGFTPLEGPMMATRSGDIDPGVLLHLMKKGWSHNQIQALLTTDSGLRGVSGLSTDPRELFASKEPKAMLALELYAYRIAKAIAALTVPLKGLDAIAFTGGVGQNSKAVRTLICDHLTHLGVSLDQSSTPDLPKIPVAIHAKDSTVGVWAIPSTEEITIADLVRAAL